MFALVRKEMILQKKIWAFVLGYSAFFCLAFNKSVFADIFYTMGVTALAYIMLLTSIGYEEKSRADVALCSLPVRRRDVIRAKFVSIPLFIFLSTGILTAMSSIMRLMPLNIVIPQAAGIQILGAAFGVVLLASFYLPLYYRFGSVHFRLLNVGLFMVVFFFPQFLAGYITGNPEKEWVRAFLKAFGSWSSAEVGGILIGTSLLVLVISCLVTVKIYERKDF